MKKRATHLLWRRLACCTGDMWQWRARARPFPCMHAARLCRHACVPMLAYVPLVRCVSGCGLRVHSHCLVVIQQGIQENTKAIKSMPRVDRPWAVGPPSFSPPSFSGRSAPLLPLSSSLTMRYVRWFCATAPASFLPRPAAPRPGLCHVPPYPRFPLQTQSPSTPSLPLTPPLLPPPTFPPALQICAAAWAAAVRRWARWCRVREAAAAVAGHRTLYHTALMAMFFRFSPLACTHAYVLPCVCE